MSSIVQVFTLVVLLTVRYRSLEKRSSPSLNKSSALGYKALEFLKNLPDINDVLDLQMYQVTAVQKFHRIHNVAASFTFEPEWKNTTCSIFRARPSQK